MANDLLRRQASTAEMLAVFDDAALIEAMLAFERGLAEAEAKVGVIPDDAARGIAAMCSPELYDYASLAERAVPAGSLAIPLVQDLTGKVAATHPEAAPWVHFGATSQDVLDTALVLQLRRAVGLLTRDVDAALDALADLIEKHTGTLMVGRTLMQPATPITFAFKAAGWRSALERGRRRITEAAQDALLLQLGGATGTLAALGSSGPDVRATLADLLELKVPEQTWHVHRDRLVALTAATAILVGTLAKIARDISLLMQSEVAEVFEPEAAGRGGSSAMPHKRNPVGCMVALAAATRVPGLFSSHLSAMLQEHERGLGGWQAEWMIVPELFETAAGALSAMREVIEGLRIDAANMRRNLASVEGLVLSERLSLRLARHYDRSTANQLVKEACEKSINEKRGLTDVAAEDQRIGAHLSRTEIEELLDPTAYLGTAKREEE